MQVPLLTTVSKAQHWALKCEHEALDVTVEVGDDGLPVGVFERHRLSPRKAALAAVTHQQHLDSWRLSELRTFRLQQEKREAEEEARNAGAAIDEACDSSGPAMASSVQARTSITAATAAMQHALLNSKSAVLADCEIADMAAARTAAADSAVQSMFSRHSMPFEKPRQKPGLRIASRHPLFPRLQHCHTSPAFIIPTTVDLVRDASEKAPKAPLAGLPGVDGKLSLEENLWGGLGGFGRNGRSKGPSSSAALQTPRLQVYKERYVPLLAALSNCIWCCLTSICYK